MQGTAQSSKQEVSKEDKYFEIYTKIRYYLKGLKEHEKGKFDTSRRPRTSEGKKEQYIQGGINSQFANVLSWKAFYGKVLQDEEEENLMDKTLGNDFLSLEMDPLVHAKESWDQLMELQKK